MAHAPAANPVPIPASGPPTGTRRRPTFHTLRVREVKALCPDAAAIAFDVPDALAAEFAHRPGQTLTLRRVIDGRDERRSYSLCSPAGSPPRIGVRKVPGGVFSCWLVDQVRPGDAVEIMAPSGTFVPDLGEPGHHVLIAAGSGITPMLSIAESVLAVDASSQVTLFYGNRRTDTVMFADELADLKDLYPARFQLAHVLSREPREAELLTGRLDTVRLTALIGGLVDAARVDHWWLCGPHGMVTDARRLLGRLGVLDVRVHQELFFADGMAEPAPRREEEQADGPVSQVTVILDGRTTTAPLPLTGTVLDTASRIRPDLPFACKGGVCGTCRARITHGEAEMRRNYALEPAEVEAGYVLTCQTFPVSEAVTIDFDN